MPKWWDKHKGKIIAGVICAVIVAVAIAVTVATLGAGAVVAAPAAAAGLATTFSLAGVGAATGTAAASTALTVGIATVTGVAASAGVLMVGAHLDNKRIYDGENKRVEQTLAEVNKPYVPPTVTPPSEPPPKRWAEVNKQNLKLTNEKEPPHMTTSFDSKRGSKDLGRSNNNPDPNPTEASRKSTIIKPGGHGSSS